MAGSPLCSSDLVPQCSQSHQDLCSQGHTGLVTCLNESHLQVPHRPRLRSGSGPQNLSSGCLLFLCFCGCDACYCVCVGVLVSFSGCPRLTVSGLIFAVIVPLAQGSLHTGLWLERYISGSSCSCLLLGPEGSNPLISLVFLGTSPLPDSLQDPQPSAISSASQRHLSLRRCPGF